MDSVTMNEEELKQKLTPEEYHVLREKGTEAPFSGELDTEFRDGMYFCKVCGSELFSSETKYDAGCGWPSFYDAVSKGNVNLLEDRAHGMIRTEVQCRNCNSHLGHVFPDGPQPSGNRFCINSVALQFKPTEKNG